MVRRFSIWLLKAIPQKWVSRQAGKLARSRISRRAIPWFIRRYGVDWQEAEAHWREYPSLGEFFIRKLKPGQRIIDQSPNTVVSPVDGVVSQLGKAEEGHLIQAKGVNYSLAGLLGDETEASRFYGGHYITIYLSPKDYHRIHVPVSGRISGYRYCPGKLFPVNQIGVQGIPGLFARNERLITYIDTDAESVALVKVGATIVGSVRVLYDSVRTNSKGKPSAEQWKEGHRVQKGDEVGYFQFGSTVILVFEPGSVEWRDGLSEGTILRMGETIAQRIL